MTTPTNPDGIEDVNDFLLRIRELGDRRDKEDEERTKKLEDEILQGRKERQARRAERARSIAGSSVAGSISGSISGSPTLNPLRLSASSLSHPSIEPPFQLDPTLQTPDPEPAMEPFETGDSRRGSVQDTEMESSPRAAPAFSRSRAGTLSWQQRPQSRDFGSRSSASTSPTRSSHLRNASVASDDRQVSSARFSQSFSMKDIPTLRQTPDLGPNSPAQQKNEEFNSQVDLGFSRQMTGMNRESSAEPEKAEEERPRTASTIGDSNFSNNRFSSVSSVSLATGLGSPAAFTDAPKLDPSQADSEEDPLPASPTQRRMSERSRSTSPTKGLGGFVQSAMMRRSDSVSKRWSAQIPQGLSRSNSTVSNRNSFIAPSLASATDLAHPTGSGINLENDQLSGQRPGSSHSEATVQPSEFIERPTTPSSRFTENTRFGTASPTRPSSRHSRSASSVTADTHNGDSSSPFVSRTMDPRRWSPTKASWLESALNRPESPRSQRPPSQSSWARDRQSRTSVDMGRVNSFKEVTPVGLMRTTPGASFKPNVGTPPVVGSPSLEATKPKETVPESPISGRNGHFKKHSISGNTSILGSPSLEATRPIETVPESPASVRSGKFNRISISGTPSIPGSPKASNIKEVPESPASVRGEDTKKLSLSETPSILDAPKLEETVSESPLSPAYKEPESITPIAESVEKDTERCSSAMPEAEPHDVPADPNDTQVSEKTRQLEKSPEIHPTRKPVPFSGAPKPNFSLPSRTAMSSSPKSTTQSPVVDFRANLRKRDVTKDSGPQKEPEFKNVFGKLKKTETSKYVAPDELKGNILRGKAALNSTGGPKKTERVDDFRNSLVFTKEAMKAAGGSIRRNTVGKDDEPPKSTEEVPEFIAKRNYIRSDSIHSLRRTNTDERSATSSPTRPSLNDAPILPLAVGQAIITNEDEIQETSRVVYTAASDLPSSTLQNESKDIPNRVQTTENPEIPVNGLPSAATATSPITARRGTLAGRINPALAGLLTRRGSQAPTEEPKRASFSNIPSSEPSVPLSHMTKGRAKGPKRRPPQEMTSPSQSVVQDQEVGAISSPENKTSQPLEPEVPLETPSQSVADEIFVLDTEPARAESPFPEQTPKVSVDYRENKTQSLDKEISPENPTNIVSDEPFVVNTEPASECPSPKQLTALDIDFREDEISQPLEPEISPETPSKSLADEPFALDTEPAPVESPSTKQFPATKIDDREDEQFEPLEPEVYPDTPSKSIVDDLFALNTEPAPVESPSPKQLPATKIDDREDEQFEPLEPEVYPDTPSKSIADDLFALNTEAASVESPSTKQLPETKIDDREDEKFEPLEPEVYPDTPSKSIADDLFALDTEPAPVESPSPKQLPVTKIDDREDEQFEPLEPEVYPDTPSKSIADDLFALNTEAASVESPSTKQLPETKIDDREDKTFEPLEPEVYPDTPSKSIADDLFALDTEPAPVESPSTKQLPETKIDDRENETSRPFEPEGFAETPLKTSSAISKSITDEPFILNAGPAPVEKPSPEQLPAISFDDREKPIESEGFSDTLSKSLADETFFLDTEPAFVENHSPKQLTSQPPETEVYPESTSSIEDEPFFLDTESAPEYSSKQSLNSEPLKPEVSAEIPSKSMAYEPFVPEPAPVENEQPLAKEVYPENISSIEDKPFFFDTESSSVGSPSPKLPAMNIEDREIETFEPLQSETSPENLPKSMADEPARTESPSIEQLPALNTNLDSLNSDFKLGTPVYDKQAQDEASPREIESPRDISPTSHSPVLPDFSSPPVPPKPISSSPVPPTSSSTPAFMSQWAQQSRFIASSSSSPSIRSTFNKNQRPTPPEKDPPRSPRSPHMVPRVIISQYEDPPQVLLKSKHSHTLSRKMSAPSLVAQAADAREVIASFFKTFPNPQSRIDIDPQVVLTPKPDEIKIRTLKFQIWELTGDGKRQELPIHRQYVLYEGSMYLCVHLFEESDKNCSQVYLWCGDDVSESALDAAQVSARKISRENGCKLEVVRQGKECMRFIQALGGIMITRRGSSSRTNSSALYMLCGRKHLGQMVFDEVDYSLRSLCSGFPYVVSAPFGKQYLWKGKGSSPEETGAARLISMDLGLTGEFEEVEESEETECFFQDFAGSREANPVMFSNYWQLKPKYAHFRSRLIRVDHELSQPPRFWMRRPGSGSPALRPNDTVQEIEPYCYRDLVEKNVYVLDTFFEIFVIVGELATQKPADFASALIFAHEYGILAASLEDRPFIPKSHVSLGGIPDRCQSAFRKWSPRSLHAPCVFPLNVAIEAIRST
ncbi:hypothetical protein N7495_002232 [Penicillium taxi]|uniref:uncharacterized protein n=1 Tax=Penicillium taxi TaxID=168475 RepID=UPI002544EF73|nr:uncharacterized protein N7495_002232 [Penicillium taxi]KAJ5901704.1 hypothetical protein N7495_002232 [Penicillium taxi]